jgi:hypothetical protein
MEADVTMDVAVTQQFKQKHYYGYASEKEK